MITNYHRFSALKQQEFILSQFWRPEIWNQDAGKGTTLVAVVKNPPANAGRVSQAQGRSHMLWRD